MLIGQTEELVNLSQYDVIVSKCNYFHRIIYLFLKGRKMLIGLIEE